MQVDQLKGHLKSSGRKWQVLPTKAVAVRVDRREPFQGKSTGRNHR